MDSTKDGQRLTGYDEAFMKDVMQFHERADKKMENFEAFEVNVHP